MTFNEISGLFLTHLSAAVLGFAFGHYRGWLSEYKHHEQKEAENEGLESNCGPMDKNIKRVTIINPKTGKKVTLENE
jgi:hypothetical protein